MTHIILTGSTGTAGAAILAKCISSTSITKISILSRRPVAQAQGVEKAHVHLHDDFTTYPARLLDELKDATACIWALGVPTGAVPAAEYRTITYTYPLSFARAILPALSPPAFTFIHISGQGATRHPGRFTQLFARVKGETEIALLAPSQSDQSTGPPTHQPIFNVWNLRPGMIDETLHPRKEGKKTAMYAVMDKTAPVWRAVMKGAIIDTEDLAKVSVGAAVGELGVGGVGGVGKGVEGKGVVLEEVVDGGQGVLVENVGLRRLAEADGMGT